jgi:acetylornithine deacetylase/succinyl-diaminopimelate desuccinylase-like protein
METTIIKERPSAMKGGVTMLLAAFLRAHAERLSLPGDLVLCILSDEENGSTS